MFDGIVQQAQMHKDAKERGETEEEMISGVAPPDWDKAQAKLNDFIGQEILMDKPADREDDTISVLGTIHSGQINNGFMELFWKDDDDGFVSGSITIGPQERFIHYEGMKAGDL